MAKFGVGQAVRRVEDQALLVGAGLYTDDLSVPGMAHAFILRSPHANARILSIETGDAEAAEGVLAVYTGADAAKDGLGDMPCSIPMTNRDGSERAETPHPVIAKDHVRHVGDPVAVVIAETLLQARDAAEQIVVDYEDLPAATDTYGATQDGSPQVWDNIANNIAFDWESGDEAAVDKALKVADRVVKLRLVNNRVVANPMEPRACLAEYDSETDRSTLHTPTQGPHVIHGPIAEVILKIGKEKLRVRSGNVGGAFGMKIFPHPEQPMAVWASRKLKRAVKWTSERTEAFMTDVQGRDNVSFAELGLDKDGKFLGLKVTNYANMGAYLSNFAPFVATGGTAMVVGLYTTPAIYVNVKGVVTNTVWVDAYRGAGRPEAAYLIERLVDAAARELDMAPDEIRRRNFIPASAMPYTTPLGDVYDSGDFATLMDRAMKQADWSGFDKRRAASEKSGKWRGIGLATYVERCGGGAPEIAVAKFGADDTITLSIGNQDNGQGHATSYMQIMSGALGVDADTITVVQGDTDTTPGGFTGGSRALPVGGAAVLGVSEDIRKKGLAVAAHAMEVAPADVEFDDGSFTVVGTDKRMSLFEVARFAREEHNPFVESEEGLDSEFTRTPDAATFPNGCHVVEVEVDPDTGVTEILRYTVLDDFGQIINPLLLAGQVHGGIVQGVGQALYEKTVYEDGSGQLLSGSFMDYTLPRADNFPEFAFDTKNVPCTTNPLGVKGAGEAGAIGAPPAVINAIVDAIYGKTGITHIDMPATTLSVWRAIHEATRQAAE